MASSFRSNDISVSDILSSISKADEQLPDFQRGWVWDDYRIRALIASISNSYPVGAVQEQRIFSDSDLPYSTQLIPLAAAFTLLDGAIDEIWFS